MLSPSRTSYRLSTAFALGWSFRSAIGFEIEAPTRSGLWATDERDLQAEPSLPLQIGEAEALVGDRLLVAVGILRDPTPDVVASLGLPDGGQVLTAVLPQALNNGAEAQLCVRSIKAAVSAAVGRLGVKGIDLFMAGPAAFAVALGHRWNALPPTQMHEFRAPERRYVKTLLLG